MSVSDATFQDLKRIIQACDRAITAEDFDTLMTYYADDATLVVKPGMHATGREQIRRAFVAIAEYFKHSMVVTQGEMKVIESGDTALVLMQTMLHTKGEGGEPITTERRATYVFRQAPAGNWLCAIDNSYGTDLIDAD